MDAASSRAAHRTAGRRRHRTLRAAGLGAAAACVAGLLWATATTARAARAAQEQQVAVSNHRLVEAQRHAAQLQAHANHEQADLVGQLRLHSALDYAASVQSHASSARAAAQKALAAPAGPHDALLRARVDDALAALTTAADLPRLADAATLLQQVTGALTDAQQSGAGVPAPAPIVAATPKPDPVDTRTSIQVAAETTLRSLPNSAGVHLAWDDPGLSGHLGGVFEGNTPTILINGVRLAGDPGKASDVVRHELAHIYQGVVSQRTGLSWDQIKDAQTAAFGANASEKVADCVARRFGATWTHYTSDCAAPDKQAWVSALIDERMP